MRASGANLLFVSFDPSVSNKDRSVRLLSYLGIVRDQYEGYFFVTV
jgi:hypothetical protein